MHEKEIEYANEYFWRRFRAASVFLALATPMVAFGQNAGQRSSYHNFAADQSSTQAERDLIERLRQRIRENRKVEASACGSLAAKSIKATSFAPTQRAV